MLSTVLVISILPVIIISIILYFNMKVTLENQLNISNQRYLKQTANAIELVIKQINNNCRSIISNVLFKEYENYPRGSYYEKLRGEFNDSDLRGLAGYLDIKKKLIDNICLLKSTNDFIYSVYYYDKQKDIILTSEGVQQYSLKEFYDKDWYMESEKTSAAPFAIDSLRTIVNGNQHKEVIPIIYMSPTTGTNIIVINLDADYIYDNIIKRIGYEDNNTLLVLSETGNVIFNKNNYSLYKKLFENIDFKKLGSKYNSFIMDLNNRKMMISYMPSDIIKWSFFNVTDLEVFNKGIIYLRALIILTVSLLLLLTIFMDLISSRKIYNPIKSLIHYLNNYNHQATESTEVKDSLTGEFGYIKNSMQLVFNEREHLSEKLKESLPAYKEKFLCSLINNNTFSLENIKSRMETFGIHIDINHMMLMFMQLDDSKFSMTEVEEKGMEKIQITDMINDKISSKYSGIVFEKDEDRFVIIINTREDEIENFLVFVQELHELVKENFQVSCFIGIGRYCNNIKDLYVSYNDAVEALKYRIITGSDIIYIEDIIITNKQTLIYPKEKEAMLINCIQTGDRKETRRLIKEIAMEVLSQGKKVSYHQIQNAWIKLMNSMMGTIDYLNIDFDAAFYREDNIYNILLEKKEPEEIIKLFEETAEKIIICVEHVLMEKTNQYIDEIVKSLEEDYSGNTSLNIIAEKYHLNPSYLSRLFKKSTGKTFMEYLTQIRIEKSKKFLAEGRLNINDVCKVVGYNNSYYFIKIFKEYTGITPGEFKKLCVYKNNA